MADIAQIYLLPPPVRSSATDRALAPAKAPEDGSVQAGTSAGEQARARRFRFRVHEGSDTAEAGTELDARRAGNSAAATASSINLGNSGSLQSRGGQSGRATDQNASLYRPGAGASSVFLAQSIAQEQLGEGLHNPPFAAATTAYTQTGAALTARPSAGVDITA